MGDTTPLKADSAEEEDVPAYRETVTVQHAPTTTGVVDKVLLDPPRTERRRRRTFYDRKLFVVASGVAAVLVASLMLIIAGRGNSYSDEKIYVFPPAPKTLAPAASATGTPKVVGTQRDAVAWMESNLARGDSIAADPSVAAALTQVGFTRLSATRDRQHLAGDIKYVITHTPSTPPALKALLAKSIPVAIFGSGPSATTVSQVQSSDAKALARMMSRNREARLAAGRQLALNSRLTVASEVLPAIERGTVDLRAETLLALLTQNGDVRLDAVPQSDAERRAHAPIRTVVVTVGDVAKARRTVDALPAAYQAQSTKLARPARLTIQFPVQGVPVMPVS